MEDDRWKAEFVAEPLATGRFVPLVKLHRGNGAGAHESMITLVGDYATEAEAVEIARRFYQPPPDSSGQPDTEGLT